MEEDGHVFTNNFRAGHAIAVTLKRSMTSDEKNKQCAITVESVRAAVGGNVEFTLEQAEFSPDVQTIIIKV